MIKVYLTPSEKRNFKREAKATGLTMSALAAHKFMNTNGKELTFGNKTRNKTAVFGFSLAPNLRGRVEYAAFQNGTSMTEFVREVITNN